MVDYKVLSKEEQEFFVEHGWLKIENAIDPQYLKPWLEDFWIRLGYDEHDKTTWKESYLKMPRHREVETYKYCPKAWAAMCEIVGGEQNVDPTRERFYGDQWIVNFGSEEGKTRPDPPPNELRGWHTDNDWYRHFLDSGRNALTIIMCISDVPEGGGGTWVCEDGIEGITRFLLNNPQGIDPPMGYLYKHVPHCKKFSQVVAKAGDVIITHGLLPHSAGINHLHYPRIITNPHLNMHEPFNLNRPEGEEYTLAEQVILRSLGRDSVPEFKPTRPRQDYFPRTAAFKRGRAEEELHRMIAAAKSKGLGPESVDSIYLKGEDLIREHEMRNGYDKPRGPAGVQDDPTHDREGWAFEANTEREHGNSLDVMKQISASA